MFGWFKRAEVVEVDTDQARRDAVMAKYRANMAATRERQAAAVAAVAAERRAELDADRTARAQAEIIKERGRLAKQNRYRV